MKKIVLIFAVAALFHSAVSIDSYAKKTAVSSCLVKKMKFPKKPMENLRFVSEVVSGEEIAEMNFRNSLKETLRQESRQESLISRKNICRIREE